MLKKKVKKKKAKLASADRIPGRRGEVRSMQHPSVGERERERVGLTRYIRPGWRRSVIREKGIRQWWWGWHVHGWGALFSTEGLGKLLYTCVRTRSRSSRLLSQGRAFSLWKEKKLDDWFFFLLLFNLL